MSLNTTPRTWVSGEVVTAAHMNAEVRDALTGIQAAWTEYTPTLTNITLGNGTMTARYWRVGKTITVNFVFAAGTTTTYAAGSLGISTPTTMNTVGGANGVAYCHNGSTATRNPGVIIQNSTTQVGFQFGAGVAGATNLIPFTWGTAAALTGTFTYEAV